MIVKTRHIKDTKKIVGLYLQLDMLIQNTSIFLSLTLDALMGRFLLRKAITSNVPKLLE